MTCRDLTDFIMAYLSGEIAPGDRVRFERHLSVCVNCQKYLTAYQETVKLGKRAFEDDSAEVPGDVPDELVRAILASRHRA